MPGGWNKLLKEFRANTNIWHPLKKVQEQNKNMSHPNISIIVAFSKYSISGFPNLYKKSNPWFGGLCNALTLRGIRYFPTPGKF